MCMTDVLKIEPQERSLAKLNHESTYLVTGGLGGLGRAVIRYLVKLGARHIMTLSRSGAEGSIKEAFVKEMRDAGVELTVHLGSVAKLEDIERLKYLTPEIPIRGLVHGAMDLQVCLSRRVDIARFDKICRTQWCQI